MSKNIFAILTLFVVLVYLLNIGMTKSERNECLKLQKQQEQFSRLFYITEAERAMCEAHGIEI